MHRLRRKTRLRCFKGSFHDVRLKHSLKNLIITWERSNPSSDYNYKYCHNTQYNSAIYFSVHINWVTTLTFGLSCWHQARNCAFLSNNSVYQKPNVVDSQEIWIQIKKQWAYYGLITSFPENSFSRIFCLKVALAGKPASIYYVRP